MKLKVIYTDRFFKTWPSWHIIYEWEDVFSEGLELKLTDSRKAFVATKYTDSALRFLSRKLFQSSNKLLPAIDRLIDKQQALYFELEVEKAFYFTGSKNTMPVIIDFWKDADLKAFYQVHKNCRAVLISSLEVYNFLRDSKCPLNIFHFPLSLSDKYRLAGNSKFNKIYDIVIPGRGNPVLWEYMRAYEIKFPRVEYLYQKGIDGELYYISNKSGIVDKFHDRASYMNLLRSAKVSFYSTPGIDGEEERTGGFSPVTPRFLEMISAGCKVIARYPKNADTLYYEMDKVCVSSDSYAVFETELSKALNADTSCFSENEAYLKNHYTSVRVDLLKTILNQVN